MFVLHYVGPNGQLVDKATSGAAELNTAVSTARQRIRDTSTAIPYDPSRPQPTGFLIYDATGSELLHRENLS